MWFQTKCNTSHDCIQMIDDQLQIDNTFIIYTLKQKQAKNN